MADGKTTTDPLSSISIEELEQLKALAAKGKQKWTQEMAPLFTNGLAIIVAVLIFFGALKAESGGESILTYIWDECLRVVHFSLTSIGSLAVAWGIRFVIARKWYDAFGSGVEMGQVRDRVGTDQEQPMDSVSIAIDNTAFIILILALVVVSLTAVAA